MKAYEIPHHAKLFGEYSDGSAYAISDHMDGSWLHLTTEKGGQMILRGYEDIKKVNTGYGLN